MRYLIAILLLIQSFISLAQEENVEEFTKYNGAETSFDIELLIKFIVDFDEYSNENLGFICNGPDRIAIENNGVVSAKTIYDYKWNNYYKFRRELFGF